MGPLKIIPEFYPDMIVLRAGFGWWPYNHLHYPEEADGLVVLYSKMSQRWLDTVARGCQT